MINESNQMCCKIGLIVGYIDDACYRVREINQSTERMGNINLYMHLCTISRPSAPWWYK